MTHEPEQVAGRLLDTLQHIKESAQQREDVGLILITAFSQRAVLLLRDEDSPCLKSEMIRLRQDVTEAMPALRARADKSPDPERRTRVHHNLDILESTLSRLEHR